MKIKKLLTQAVLLTLILYGFYYLEHELKRENTLLGRIALGTR